jgi:phosphatidylglycerol:prolipoprotein diacylglycerol transferase
MRPLLVDITLSSSGIPVAIVLGLVSVLGLVILFVGVGRRRLPLGLAGGILAVTAGIGAHYLRHTRYLPEGFSLNAYGAALALSFVAGWFLTERRALASGIDRERAATCFVVTAVGALVAARVLYVLTNIGQFESVGDVLAVGRGGMTAYGGLVGGCLASWLYLRRVGLPVLPWADAAAPSVLLGIGVTRLGCYAFGCDFGVRLGDAAPSLLRALGTFPRWGEEAGRYAGMGAPAFTAHVERAGLSPFAEASLPVHPTQLYESLGALALFGLLSSWRAPRRRGDLFLAATFGYGSLRFMIEPLRGDLERGLVGPALPVGVTIAIGVVLMVAAFLAVALRTRRLRELALGASAVGVVVAALAFLSLGGWTPESPDIKLSVSALIGLASALAAALAWAIVLSRSPAPEGASKASRMQNDPPDDPKDDASSAERPPIRKRRQRITVRATPVAIRDAGESEPPPPPEDQGSDPERR